MKIYVVMQYDVDLEPSPYATPRRAFSTRAAAEAHEAALTAESRDVAEEKNLRHPMYEYGVAECELETRA